MANNQNIYENKRYKTERDASYIKKLKYIKIDTENKFEEAFNELNGSIYTSQISERHRDIYKKKKFVILNNKENALSKFEKLINSFLYSLNKKFDIEMIKKNEIYYLANGNIHKLLFLENNQIFISTFIYKDVIYTDKFSFENVKNNIGKYYIKIQKNMKTPFSLEKISLMGAMSRNEFRKGWKNYIFEVKKGLRN